MFAEVPTYKFSKNINILGGDECKPINKLRSVDILLSCVIILSVAQVNDNVQGL